MTLLSVAVCLGVAIAAVVVRGLPPERTKGQSVRADAAGQAYPATTTSSHAPLDPALAADFGALEEQFGGEVGLAVAPLGNPAAVQLFGHWRSGSAWSTMKVPLSLALLREPGDAAVTDNIRSAITSSNNAAAQAIWDQLGSGREAATKVEAVLAEAGDHTEVVSEVRRAGFSAFGQSDWSLADQVRFLSWAACDAPSAPVLELMAHIVSGQRWGLGALDGSRFKGGWGPGIQGGYLVRQYGVIGGDRGIVVAIAAQTGGFGAGTAALDAIASWLGEHRAEFSTGSCA